MNLTAHTNHRAVEMSIPALFLYFFLFEHPAGVADQFLNLGIPNLFIVGGLLFEGLGQLGEQILD
jgi:hypothetical protein